MELLLQESTLLNPRRIDKILHSVDKIFFRGSLFIEMDYFSISALINAFTSIILGVFVLAKNRKSPVGFSFFLFAFSVFIWSFCYFFWQQANSSDGALLWSRGLMAGATLIPFSYLYFVLVFLNRVKKEKFVFILASVVTLILTVSNLTSLVVKGVAPKLSFPFWPEPGIFFPLFLASFFGFVVYSSILLYKAYRKQKNARRSQIAYVLTGMVIGFAGGSTNFLLWYNIPIPPIANVLVSLYVGFVAYAIIRYRLMDIRIVIRKSIVTITALATIISIGLLLMYAETRLFNNALSPATAGAVILGISVLLYNPVRNRYLKLANKYFFTSLYNYQKTIEDLTRSLTTVIELKKVVDMIVDTIMQTMGLDRAGVLILEDASAKNKKERRYSIAKIVGFDKKNGISLVKDNFLTKYLEETKKPLVYEEIHRLAEEEGSEGKKDELLKLQKNMKKIEASVCLPLTSGQKMIGLIVLGNKVARDAYTKEDLELLTTLSGQASVAIENGLLVQEVKRFNETLQSEVEKQTKEIKDLYEMKSNFLTVASHQLRTPTSIIRGTLSMLVEDDLPSEQVNKMTASAFESSSNLERVIEDILVAAEIDSSKFNFSPEPVDIIPVIKKVVKDLKLKADTKGLKLNFDEPGFKKAMAMTHATKVEQAFANLIDNALNYTTTGSVTVSIKPEKKKGQDYFTFVCKDTGIGMTKEDIKKIGEKFFRSKNVFSVHPNGTGLGVYIVKSVVDSSEGFLTVESPGLEKGSSFMISLKQATSKEIDRFNKEQTQREDLKEKS